MAGRGPINKVFHSFVANFTIAERSRIYAWNPTKQHWNPHAKEPLHHDKPEKAAVGPGLAAALTLARAFPNKCTGVVWWQCNRSMASNHWRSFSQHEKLR